MINAPNNILYMCKKSNYAYKKSFISNPMFIIFITIQYFLSNWLVNSLQQIFRQFICTTQLNAFAGALALNQNHYFDGDLQ